MLVEQTSLYNFCQSNHKIEEINTINCKPVFFRIAVCYSSFSCMTLFKNSNRKEIHLLNKSLVVLEVVCWLNYGEEITSNVSKSSDHLGTVFYVSIYVSLTLVFLKHLCNLQVRIVLTNTSLFTILLCIAKDYWKLKKFSVGLIKIFSFHTRY